MKIAVIALAAGLINVFLFVLMEAMVERDRTRLLNTWETQTVDFVRVPMEDQLRKKDRRRKPPPKPEEIEKPRARMDEMLAETMELPAPIAALDITNMLSAGGVAVGGRLVDGHSADIVNMLEENLVPISKYPPNYPYEAARRGLDGYVELVFIVREDGTVENPQIVTSAPGQVFDKSALEAVRRWRYRPPMVDGVPSRARVRAFLEYELD